MSPKFKMKRTILALAIAGCMITNVQATLTTPVTGTIKGRAPILVAPSNSASHAIDFTYSGTQSTLVVGETITLTYKYTDEDGDGDASDKHITWFSTKDGGTTKHTIATGVLSTAAGSVGGTGTSVLTIPVTAVDEMIGVEITEYSASGDPVAGTTITVNDTHTGGGGSVTPVGPVVPGETNLVAGIYASTDTTFATNLMGKTTNLLVGQSYVFKLWLDADGDGTPDTLTSASDYTTKLNYNWRLVGTSATTGTSAPTTGFVTSVNNGDFTVPVNTAPNGTPLTGSADGAQGFGLAVDFNNKPSSPIKYMVNHKAIDTK
ncbi:SinI family autotransporter-associated protein [Yersinia intermedia]|uniref:SinI family autotransporter-associated protein n=1 Tax=Yersinia intermedia TaxID=631 RepID=UPI0005EA4234|nr:SinI family autotransporter-associated protein [Yersinia intermedia]CND47867.1 intimin-like protein SinH [Yersinia intermedia]